MSIACLNTKNNQQALSSTYQPAPSDDKVSQAAQPSFSGLRTLAYMATVTAIGFSAYWLGAASLAYIATAFTCNQFIVEACLFKSIAGGMGLGAAAGAGIGAIFSVFKELSALFKKQQDQEMYPSFVLLHDRVCLYGVWGGLAGVCSGIALGALFCGLRHALSGIRMYPGAG